MSTYVSVSHLRFAADAASGLIHAFRQPVHLVVSARGFQRLEVWQSSERGEILTGQALWGASALAGVLAAVRALGPRNWKAT